MEENPFVLVLERLRKLGHCKGRLGSKAGPNCLNGAALHEGVMSSTFVEITNKVALEQYPERVEGIHPANFFGGVNFNNHPDTTFEDVERVLEKAAVRWEEERVMRDE